MTDSGNTTEVGEEQTDKIFELVDETIEDWANDPELHIFVEDGTFTADIEDLRIQWAYHIATIIEAIAKSQESNNE